MRGRTKGETQSPSPRFRSRALLFQHDLNIWCYAVDCGHGTLPPGFRSSLSRGPPVPRFDSRLFQRHSPGVGRHLSQTPRNLSKSLGPSGGGVGHHGHVHPHVPVVLLRGRKILATVAHEEWRQGEGNFMSASISAEVPGRCPSEQAQEKPAPTCRFFFARRTGGQKKRKWPWANRTTQRRGHQKQTAKELFCSFKRAARSGTAGERRTKETP